MARTQGPEKARASQEKSQMILLALDTATETCAVALLRDGRPVAELTADRSETHSRHLMDVVERVLRTAGVELADIAVFAASHGPGGFTGLRIGLATVKGLAFAMNRPAIGVSTLETLAFQTAWTGAAGPSGTGDAARPSLEGTPVLEALIDARKKEVYAGRFRMTADGPVVMGPERVLPPSAVLDELAGDDAIHLFVGNGALLYRDLIHERLGDRAWFAAVDTHAIRATSIGRLAWTKFQAGEASPAAALAPVYLRPSDAEIHWGGAASAAPRIP